ncbi:MAG: 3-octaprenyl-4-hydroxybenzoate carboxy-lyase [Planctomycetes bacterium]|nr:3-octaprenyl-4-hydroxybenzoate carboxy-lyase [Planctomycetota bacterium]
MAFDDLESFIDALREAGELLEFREPVSIDQEIACAADRVSKLPGGGPALLFHRPIGPDGREYRAPVLINALGSEKRLSMVCGVKDFHGLTERLSGLLEDLQTPRRTLIEKLEVLPTLKQLAGFFPKYVKKAPCQEIVHTGDAIDLDTIPILKTWPDDGGRFVTFPLVFTHSPKDGKRNCGMYRIQQFDKRTTGFHVHTHHTAAEHMRQAVARGEKRLPAAIAIGGAPAITFSAVVPLPPGMDEMILAGFLQGRPVKMVECKTVPLQVPASADYVIEGWIHIDERRREGPFGDHTGFYSLADDYPVFHVSAITQRRKPVYFATVVGPPPQEDAWMAQAIERLFLPLMQQTIPEVIDYRLPFSGVAHNLMLVKIHKSYPGQARKVAHAIWGLGQAMFTKTIVVIDQHGPDVHDEAAVARWVLQHLDATSSFEFVLGPTETLDHATRALHFGSKVCIDASIPLPGDVGTQGQGTGILGIAGTPGVIAQAPMGPRGPIGPVSDPDVVRQWQVGDLVTVLELNKTRGHQPRELANAIFKQAGDAALPLVVFLPAGLIKAGDLEALVWAALANIDPERDLLFDETPEQVNGRWVLKRHPRHIAVDATKKDAHDGFERDWPEMQVHPRQVLAKVRALLKAKGIEMPTSFLP